MKKFSLTKAFIAVYALACVTSAVMNVKKKILSAQKEQAK